MKFNFSVSSMNFASISNLQQTVKFAQIKEQVNSQGTPRYPNPYENDPRNITNKNYQKLVPVSDKVKQELMNDLKESFEKRGGMSGVNPKSPMIINKYLETLPATERSSAAYTLGQFKINAAHRIATFIKDKDTSWDWGKPVKSEILAEAFKSQNFDIKA